MTLPSVFVYGTLMPGQRNELVARAGGAFTAQRACLAGFVLFDLQPEGYPVITPGDGRVWGWVYTYAEHDWPRALAHLDALEGVNDVPPLYRRERVQAQLITGREVESWVYVFAFLERLEAGGVTRVHSGCWSS